MGGDFATLLAVDSADGKTYDDLFPAIERKGRSTIKFSVGYINNRGDQVIEPQFEEADWFFDGLAVAQTGGRWGLIDTQGHWAVAPEWTLADRFSSGLAQVSRRSGRRSEELFVDARGRIAVEGIVGFPLGFDEGLCVVRTEDASSCSLINSKGERLHGEFEHLGPIVDGLVNARKEGLRGYFDVVGGDWRIPPQFDCEHVGAFQEGLARAGRDGKYGFIDLDGNFIIDPIYESVRDFSEGLAAFGTNEHCYGYLDRNGSTKFRLKNAWYCSAFSEGLVEVRIEEPKGETKAGFMNPDGEFIIPPQFESTTPFRNGLSLVGKDWDTGYIDQQGEYVWKGKYVRCGLWYNQPYHSYPCDEDRRGAQTSTETG